VLTAADELALERLCENLALLKRAREILGDELVIDDRDGAPRTHPAWRICRDLDARLNAWLREFGLTPASRSGLSLDDLRDVEAELERQLGGPR
jgi:P27 family predicted phage terminase small subunit